MIDLASVTGFSSAVNATLVPAGAVAPALSLGSNANECSFAQVARDAVRGGPWIAVTADLPQPSIYVSPLTTDSFCKKCLQEKHRDGAEL